MLNGQCSGICGGASFREERLTLAERGRNGRFKNDDHGRPEGEQGAAFAPPWIWSFSQTFGQDTDILCQNTKILSKY